MNKFEVDVMIITDLIQNNYEQNLPLIDQIFKKFEWGSRKNDIAFIIFRRGVLLEHNGYYDQLKKVITEETYEPILSEYFEQIVTILDNDDFTLLLKDENINTLIKDLEFLQIATIITSDVVALENKITIIHHWNYTSHDHTALRTILYSQIVAEKRQDLLTIAVEGEQDVDNLVILYRGLGVDIKTTAENTAQIYYKKIQKQPGVHYLGETGSLILKYLDDDYLVGLLPKQPINNRRDIYTHISNPEVLRKRAHKESSGELREFLINRISAMGGDPMTTEDYIALFKKEKTEKLIPMIQHLGDTKIDLVKTKLNNDLLSEETILALFSYLKTELTHGIYAEFILHWIETIQHTSGKAYRNRKYEIGRHFELLRSANNITPEQLEAASQKYVNNHIEYLHRSGFVPTLDLALDHIYDQDYLDNLFEEYFEILFNHYFGKRNTDITIGDIYRRLSPEGMSKVLLAHSGDEKLRTWLIAMG